MGKGILDTLFQVDKDQPSLVDSLDNAGKVVVQQNHSSSIL